MSNSSLGSASSLLQMSPHGLTDLCRAVYNPTESSRPTRCCDRAVLAWIPSTPTPQIPNPGPCPGSCWARR